MKQGLRLWSLGCFWLAVLSMALGVEESRGPVVVEFFFEPGCAECHVVDGEILPELMRLFPGKCVVQRYDVGIMTNYLRLANYHEEFKIVENEPVSMVLHGSIFLSGLEAMQTNLFNSVKELTATHVDSSEWTAQVCTAPDSSTEPGIFLRKRMERFGFPLLMLAGVTDGINPCAISTLVFFMSLLGVSKINGRALLLLGMSFILATFITYTALGFGLLRVLHLLDGFFWVRSVLEGLFLLLLGFFAFLSFRDACKYKISEKPEDVTLQLPESVKGWIHTILRGVLRWKAADSRDGNVVSTSGMLYLVLGGVVAGAGVTALESVCTGQMYVPTLVMVIKTGAKGLPRAWVCLLLYNLMFVLPLVAVFLCVYWGLRTETLLAWSRKNVVVSKVLIGLLLLFMAMLIAFT